MFARDYFLSIPEDAVFTGIRVADKRQLMAFLAAQFSQTYKLDNNICQNMLSDREALGSTGFGRGVAIPHARMSGISSVMSILVQLEHPFNYGAVDNEPVDLIWALISPEHGGSEHLKALAHISRLLRDHSLVQQLRGARDARAVHALVSEHLQRDAA